MQAANAFIVRAPLRGNPRSGARTIQDVFVNALVSNRSAFRLEAHAKSQKNE